MASVPVPVFLGLLLIGSPLSVQAADLPQVDRWTDADSTDLLREARNAQARFVRTRVRHAPFSWWSGTGPCDERVGRFCIRFGTDRDDDEEDRPSWTPPPDPPQVAEARAELLETLARIGRAQPGDAWVSGQRVNYLGEVGRWEEALEVARSCRASGWWCDGLEGIALHGLGRSAEAESAFERVLAQLPEDDREEWDDPAILAEYSLYRELSGLDGEEAEQERRRVWALADPLFLVEGNPLRSEHLSRWMLSEIRKNARNGHAMSWGSDMTQLLVRYGPVVAYERIRERVRQMGPPPVVGRYDPMTRQLMPGSDAVEDPATSRPDDWATHRRHTRSRHAPPQARRIRSMDAQVARFRRDDDLLILAAWELAAVRGPGVEDSIRVEEGELSPDSLPAPFPPEYLESALFVLDHESLEPQRFMAPRTADTRGVATAQIPPGRYLLSLEGLDAQASRAWRQRQGLEQGPRHRDVIALSDLLLLEPSANGQVPTGQLDVDESPPPLDSLLLRAYPTTSLPPGRVEVVWEIYGLSPREDRLRFRLTASREDRGVLRRLGETLRIVSPPDPVELRWEEGVNRNGDSAQAPYLRRVSVDLSGLDPGAYRLALTLTPPGRTPTTASRDLEILDPGY